MDEAVDLIQQSVAQNNAWSAEQAQKQMNFQREMSNTAHQREVADLKAAGLNPVLSAKLGGASTPSGAMAQGDTSGTSALVDLLEMAMSTANSAAGAAHAAASTVQDNSAENVSEFLDDWDTGKGYGSRNFIYRMSSFLPSNLRWVVPVAVALGEFTSSGEGAEAAIAATSKLNGTYKRDKRREGNVEESWKPGSFAAAVKKAWDWIKPHTPRYKPELEGSSNYAHESSNKKLSYRSSRVASPLVHSAKQSQHKF